MQIAMLHTRLRTEERLLLDAFESLGVDVRLVDLRTVVFDPSDSGAWASVDLALDRCVSLTASTTAVQVLEHLGVRCVNSSRTIEVCSDKLSTTLALARAQLPMPAVRVATGREAGLEAIESIGYPVVLKPTVGSWGRLVARVNDRDAAEAILEHRDTLGSVRQKIIYAQEHVDKPGRDLRVFVDGGIAVAAIGRRSEHWVTNTARGATAESVDLTSDLRALSQQAALSVGADLCAVDLLECPRRGLLINELNHSMEFRNSIDTTGIDIPRLVAEHVVSLAGATHQGVSA